MTLPVTVFRELLSQQELKVTSEATVGQAVKAYLEHRTEIKPLLDEEEPSNDPSVVALLTEEEKKSREDEKVKKEEEAKKA